MSEPSEKIRVLTRSLFEQCFPLKGGAKRVELEYPTQENEHPKKIVLAEEPWQRNTVKVVTIDLGGAHLRVDTFERGTGMDYNPAKSDQPTLEHVHLKCRGPEVKVSFRHAEDEKRQLELLNEIILALTWALSATK